MGAALTVKALTELCGKYKPQVVFLMESRSKKDKMERLRRRFRFQFGQAFYVDPVGKSGGLAVWWHDDLVFNVLFHSKNFIHARLGSVEGDVPCYLTCVYGPPLEGDRHVAWDRMRTISNGVSGAWLYCGLFDLEYKGPFFTWANNRLGDAHVKEKLDRVLGNLDLLCSFPKAQVFVDCSVGSNHCPLIVDLEFSDSKSDRSFKFEMVWLDHPDYKEVMRKGWFSSNGLWEDAVLELIRRLEDCKEGLVKWSREAFRNNKVVIAKLFEQLRSCSDELLTEDLKLRNEEILKGLEEAWDREEKYWFQRSRVNWLSFGDRNSKYFHASVMQRRRRNKILRLKNRDGNWLGSEGEVAACFTEFYSDLFKKGGSRDFSKVLDYVKPVITEADNEVLLKEVSMMEVKEAVFQLGGLKAPVPDGYSGIFYQDAWDDVDVIKEEVCDILGIKDSVDPGFYLGLPMVLGRSKVEALAFVREKVTRKVSSWRNNFLSHAGREVLVKAVVNAIPAYSMSVFKFLKKSYKELDSLISNFWWGLKEDGSKVHWKAWHKLVKPKVEGGLGFKDFESFNLSLLAKQAWRMVESPNELWVQVLKGLYFPSEDFLSAKKGHKASWVWSSILEGRKLLLEGSCWKVRDGCSVSVWGDRWIPGLEGFRLSSILPEDGIDLRVVDLIQDGSWNLSSIQEHLEPIEVKAIKAVSIPSGGGADRLVWPFSKSGKFEVKGGYRFACKSFGAVDCSDPSCSFSSPPSLWKAVWGLGVGPKVRMFLWRAWKPYLLGKHYLGGNVRCLLTARFVGWRRRRWSMLCYYNKEIDEKGLLLVASICWEVWKARCDFIFQGVQVDPMKCCLKACSAVMEICGLGKAHPRPVLKPAVVDFVPNCWIPPCKDSVKVNFDGAFKKDSLDAGVGFLVRDMDGDMWMGYSGKVFASSSLVCEALALKMAISMVDCLPDLKFIFEMDCEVLFNLNLSFSLVRRNGNQAADWLAKSALKGLAPSGWVINPPPPLARLLALDREFAKFAIEDATGDSFTHNKIIIIITNLNPEMGNCCSQDYRSRALMKSEMKEDGEMEGGNDNHVHTAHVEGEGRIKWRGSSKFVSMYTQKGKKGINQDAMTVWEDSSVEKGMTFCGVFDGHGPLGHLISRYLRNHLPIKLSEEIKTSHPQNNPNISFSSWEKCFIKSFHDMDQAIARDINTDSFYSGSTAVTLIKQDDQLILGNLGDSRAILCMRGTNDQFLPVQLTVDLKPDLPSETARIHSCEGRVYAEEEEPDVCRIWMPDEDCPGLAMSRAFGDFCLKDYGLISTPDVFYRKITDQDEFVVLASDGIWDVLTNNEVIDIVVSAPRKFAAKLLVKCAVRAWEHKFPGSNADDCAAICLFLKDRPDEEATLESGENKHQKKHLHGQKSGGFDDTESIGAVESVGEWEGLQGLSRANSITKIPRISMDAFRRQSSSRRVEGVAVY
ncbi:putative protein phosphatase 2C 65 [Senna tora]|uniref:PPM-type phosphatase domain-containing protein n=1 Tax=Senna tora TaxID=362788 RepID=A0A834TQL1_9FABA|nr:putative protein phosphatase 2C 65 [Senna tora]